MIQSPSAARALSGSPAEADASRVAHSTPGRRLPHVKPFERVAERGGLLSQRGGRSRAFFRHRSILLGRPVKLAYRRIDLREIFGLRGGGVCYLRIFVSVSAILGFWFRCWALSKSSPTKT